MLIRGRGYANPAGTVARPERTRRSVSAGIGTGTGAGSRHRSWGWGVRPSYGARPRPLAGLPGNGSRDGARPRLAAGRKGSPG